MFYQVFIDDCGKKEYRDPYSREFIDNPPSVEDYREFWMDNYFVLCAVRIKQDDLGKIDTAINDLKLEYFGTKDVEIKSTWLRIPGRRKKHYIEPFGIMDEKVNEFGLKLFDLIASFHKELRLIAVVFDKRYYGDAKRATPEGDVLVKTMQVAFERIHYAGNHNLVYIDQMEGSLSKNKGKHDDIMRLYKKNDGMEEIYVNGYDAIADVDFKESHRENFLQIADVCAYTVYRQFVDHGREWDGHVKSGDDGQMQTYEYINKIRCNFHRDWKNKVCGVGLVCIPDVTKVNWDVLKDCE